MIGRSLLRWQNKITIVFADYLLQVRQAENSVPFVCQALLMADDTNINRALEFLTSAMKMGLQLLDSEDNHSVVIYDPIPMSLMKVADKERAQLLVEAASRQIMGTIFTSVVSKALLHARFCALDYGC